MLSNLHEYGLGLIHRKQHKWKHEDSGYSPFDCNLYYEEFKQTMLQSADNIFSENKDKGTSRKLIYNISEMHHSMSESEWLFPSDKALSACYLNDFHFYFMLSAILCNAYYIFSGHIKANKYPSLCSSLPNVKASNKRMKLLFAQLPSSDWIIGLQTSINNTKPCTKYKLIINNLADIKLRTVLGALMERLPHPVTRYDESYLNDTLGYFATHLNSESFVLDMATLSYLIKIRALNINNTNSFLNTSTLSMFALKDRDVWKTECANFQIKAHKKLTNYTEIYNCFKFVDNIINNLEPPLDGAIELEGEVQDIMKYIHQMKESFSPKINGRQDLKTLVNHLMKFIRIKSQNKKSFLDASTIHTYLKNISSDYN